MLFSTEISGVAFHGDVTHDSRKLGKDEGEDTLDKLGISARDQLMIDIL